MLCQIQMNPLVFQVTMHDHQTICCGDIDTAYTSGIHHDYLRIRINSPFYFLLKTIDVGKKQIAAEPVNDRMLYGTGRAVSVQRIKITLPRDSAYERCGRSHRTHSHLRKGQKTADHYTWHCTEDQHAEKRQNKDNPFVPAGFPQSFAQRDLQNSDQCNDHNAGQDRYRQIL